MLVQKKFTDRINKGRPLDRNVIRIEISPSEEESRGWAMDDWARLADEFIRVFDSIDFSHKTGRATSKRTNLKGSQYIVALHRDAKSGILHLHIDANRVDMDGNVNASQKIGERAVMAANIINERRGWVQSKDIGTRHRQEISDCCMEILRSMKKFDWKQYEAELEKGATRYICKRMTMAGFTAIPSNGATPFISHPYWVLGEISPPQR